MTHAAKIETAREQLYKMACQQSLTSPEIIKMSQKLDKLINEYNKK